MASIAGRLTVAASIRLSSFVGRRNDIVAVRQLFTASRLVTLTGLGGVGKTRLALQVAGEMERAFPDGIYLVELASLKDPDLLPHTIMDSLQILERPTTSPLTAIGEFLAGRRVLLILDGCERLVSATASLLSHVLHASPGVSVLVTSRQALRISGEHLYPVSPLAVPDPADHHAQGRSAHYPSVALFAERAAAVVPGFAITPDNEAAVIRLVHRLEGIPLAIELASVRLRVLAVQELADKLDHRFQLLREGNRDFPERHRTLQALIDWSYDLCTPTEQLLWTRSSVFADGFGVQAVESVCTDATLPPDAVLDTLSALVEKSVLIRTEQGGQVRFRMLDTLAEYGRMRLAEQGDAARMSVRHRDWYARFLDQAERAWAGPEQEAWVARLQLERANIRHALEYCLSTPGETRAGLAMAAVPWFWGAMDHMDETRIWLERACTLDPAPSHERVWALATCAYIAGFQGDLAALRTLVQEAHDLATELDDGAGLAFAGHVRAFGLSLGSIAGAEAAIPEFTQAMAQYEKTDVPAQYADSLRSELAATYLVLERYDEATAVVDVLEQRCRDAGERWNLSYALWLRGLLELVGGGDADQYLVEALRIKRGFRETLGWALTLEAIAWSAAARGEAQRAATLLGGVDNLWQSLGRQQLQILRSPYQARAVESLGESRFGAAHAEGAQLSIDELIAIGLRETPDQAPAAAPAPKGEPAANPLSRRELEVARLVAEGLTNREIAEKLVISLRTAEGHVERALTKLGFRTRIQIANWIHSEDLRSRRSGDTS